MCVCVCVCASDRTSKKDEQDMLDTVGEVGSNSQAKFFCGFPLVDTAIKTNIHLLCTDTGCILDDLTRDIRWRRTGSRSKESILSA